MTVKELIVCLQELPEHIEVMTYDSNYSLDRPIDTVKLMSGWEPGKDVVFIE